MAERIMNKRNNIYYLILLSQLLFSCKTEPIKYKISKYYIGPCVIFIYDQASSDKDVELKDGLGKITKDQLNRLFTINNLEDNIELEGISIGKEGTAKDSSRYVFGLGEGSQSSDCSSKDIRHITFYIGHKKDYLDWSTKYHNDYLAYFDSVGIDWCDFYNKNK
jgi:hypothetical protein